MATPTIQTDRYSWFRGDWRDYARTLPDGSVDLILTDPPYGLTGQQDEEAIIVQGHAPFLRHFGEWDREWDPAALLAEANRLLRPGGSFVAFCAHEWLELFHKTPMVEKKAGVWVKTNPAPRIRPGYQHGTEFWVWHVKPGAAPTWNGGFTQSNAILVPVCSGHERTDHPTQKPLSLMAGFVRRHSNPGDLVCDLFGGTATTLVAAVQHGRRAAGCELDLRWHSIGLARLKSADTLPLFEPSQQGGLFAAAEARP